MDNKTLNIRKLFLTVLLITGWGAAGLQFYLIIVNRTLSVLDTIIRFISFFTILSNILMAVCVSALLLMPASRWGRFFGRPSVQTALAVYMTVVGLVYNLVLRHLWNPTGMQRVADEALHVVNPVLFLLYWLIWTGKRALQWKDIPAWLIYPAVYAVYVLIRGALSGDYPYPFMDVSRLGLARVLINSGGLVLVFLVFSLGAVALGKIISPQRTHI